MRHRPDDVHALASLQLRAERAVADEGQLSLPEALERAREADDVLALAQRADAEERGRALGRRQDREALEVDAGVDDLRLAARVGHLRLELASQVVGDGDHGRGATHGEARRGGDAGDRSDVAHVAAVSGHDEGRALRERGDQPGGDEEVRVDDVGARCAARGARQLEVSALPARSAVDHRAVDLVASLRERALHLRDENAEVRVVGPWIHLRDEEDAHRARR